jgi:hypothetical protein
MEGTIVAEGVGIVGVIEGVGVMEGVIEGDVVAETVADAVNVDVEVGPPGVGLWVGVTGIAFEVGTVLLATIFTKPLIVRSVISAITLTVSGFLIGLRNASAIGPRKSVILGSHKGLHSFLALFAPSIKLTTPFPNSLQVGDPGVGPPVGVSLATKTTTKTAI